ncbi:PadR family transcriptional regulator [Rhodococcus sp. NPDC058521]|uniref:PadR family transcriptional regulator n=1 Tax=Rhodococcus sp. NPDC058521 TaxID=3346536 RepID=UPI0036669C27
MEGFERGRGPRTGHGAGRGRFAYAEGPHRRGPRRDRFGFDDGMYGPGGHFGRGRGRGGRGRRGDVRAAILLLLEGNPMHGYELIQQIVGRSEGVWKPSPGSIYPALAQLEDEGLVVIEKVKGRKTARLTEEGTAYVETNRSELGSPWDDVRDTVGRSAQDLRGLIGQLMGAAGQVAAVGNEEQNRRAADVLVEARRSLYRILAEEPDAPSPDDSAGGESGPGDSDR